MSTSAGMVFFTIYPAKGKYARDVRDALESEGLPVTEQVQFAGKGALEAALKFTRDAVEQVVKIAKRLIDADKIDEITVEVGDKKVSLKGIPGHREKTVRELTDYILSRLEE